MKTGDRLRRDAAASLAWSTYQMSLITGASIRQLQTWDEMGIIVANRHQNRRVYCEEHRRKARVLAKLSASVRKLEWFKLIPKSAFRLRYLLFHGTTLVAAADHHRTIIQVATASAHGVTLIDLQD